MGEHEQSAEVAEHKEQLHREYLELIRELVSENRKFDFPGMSPDTYAKLQAEAGEYSEYATPMDELVAKFNAEGVKVVPANDPHTAIALVVPYRTGDKIMDSLFPRHLEIIEGMDPKLKTLIELNKKMRDLD